MSSDCINEGDTILLYCPEASGFLFSQPPSSNYSHVTIFPVEKTHSLRDPAFSNIHFASFQVLPEHAVVENSPLNPPKENDQGFVRSLVYGRKVKLLHVASQKYLSLVQAINSTNVVATLVEKSDADSLFRILPARAGKHRGEDVLSNDHIKLECVRQKGHHLLCSKNTITSKIELKMAINESTFTVYRTNNCTKIPQKAIRGGSVILLYHIKQESYIAGKGSILTDSLPDAVREEIVSEVGGRKRESSHGIQKAPPLSGDCFWQLEKSENPLCGDQFQYGEKCRIKHIPTQHYLAVTTSSDGHHHISLKELQPGRGQDPEINFSLLPLRGETGGILKGSYVELRHIQTGKNLNVLGKSFIQRAASDPNMDVSTKSKYYRLNLEDSNPSQQQFFRLEEVTEDIIHEFYQVSGISATLVEYMQKFTSRDTTVPFDPDLSEPQEVLDYLYRWLSDASSGSYKSKANMLRVVQGIDLLIGFLYEIDQISEGKEIENKQQLLLCRKISRVLHRYVETSNRKSHLYIADNRFMDILFKRIGYGIGVEQVLSTLVRDESDITEKVVNKLTSSDEHIEHIKQKLDAATLDFLSTLCFTSGKPVRSLQDNIRQRIIEAGTDLFFHATIVDGELCFKHPERLKGPVADIGSKDTADYFKEDFSFYVAQLRLFSRVCKGVNLESIDKIVYEHEYITFEESLLILKDPNIHPLLQSAYLDFVISAFVDFNVEESGVDIDNIWHSYDWNDLDPDPIVAAGMGDTFDIIPDAQEMRALTECIRGTLQENVALYAEEEVVGKNELLEQILSVMEPLVSYGFFWKPDEIKTIIETLLDIMDGKNDRPSIDARTKKVALYQKEDRYKSNENNKKIFKVKAKAVQVLHLFFKQYCYTTNAKIFYEYKYLKGEVEPESDSDYEPPNTELKCLLQETFEINDYDHPEHLVAIARKQLRRLTHEPAFSYFDFAEPNGERLIKILLDLLKYDDTNLHLSSCKLLFDIHQEEDILFKDSKNSYLVMEPSAETYGQMVVLGSLCDPNKVLLHMQQGTAIKDEFYETTKETLDIISRACVLADDESVPHQCNQGIIFTSGVFSAMVNYIRGYCSGYGNDRQEELLCKATHALIRTVHKNETVQKRLFEYFVDFLEVKSAVSPIAQLLTETITDNVILCRKLAEGDIRQIFQIASTNADPEYYEFYTTLIVIMKVSRISPLLLKNYQEFMSHLFSDYRNEYFGQMMHKEGRKMRQSILRDRDDDNSQLVQLLALSDMLAAAAEGEHKHCEDMCQGIFEIDELISILSDPLISYERKKPFASLLSDIYLFTERDSLVSIATLVKSKAFWKHVESCGVLMTAIKDALQENGNKEQIRTQVKALITQFISIPAWKSMSQDILGETLECDSVDHAVPLNAILFYIIEGLVPLLSTFCKQLASYSSAGLTSKIFSGLLTPQIVEILTTIGSNLAGLLLDQPSIFFSTPVHVNKWIKFLDNIISLLPDVEETYLLQEIKDRISSIGSTNYSSQAELDYNSEFKEEIQVNRGFHWFIDNYKSAYEGRVMQTEADLLLQSDELLPKGASFKRLTAKFNEVQLQAAVDEKSGKKKVTLQKVPHLLNLLTILYRQLQQPLTSLERGELDKMLLKCLQILSGVVHSHIDKLDSRKQAKNPDEFVKEYEDEVEPIQNALVAMNSHHKAMLHLSHPNDEVAVQVLAFLQAILYLGNESAQAKIGRMCSHKDTKFFQRIHKLLDIVVSNLGRPDFKKPMINVRKAVTSTEDELDDMYSLESFNWEDEYSYEYDDDDEYNYDDDDDDDDDDDGDDGGGEEGEKEAADGEELNKATNSAPAAAEPSKKQVSIEMEQTNLSSLRLLVQSSMDLDIEDDDDGADDTDTGHDEIDAQVPIHGTIRSYAIEAAGQLEATENVATQQASVVLDVISSLCDGQNLKMQDIFREQEKSFSNVNVVGQVAVLLQSLAEHASEKNLNIIKKTIQALIEMCAGNFSNQETAFKGQIVDSINLILKNLVGDNTLKTVTKMQLQASCIELLQVMLEETNENSSELAQGISEDLDVATLLKAMVQLRECEAEEDLHVEARRGMFRGFHVLKKIADYLNINVDAYVKPKVNFSDEMSEVWDHVNEWTRSIEIKYRSKEDDPGILTRVYFSFDPAKELTEEQKDIVKNNIVRESPEDKVKDLLEWMEAIRKNIQHKNAVRGRWWLRWILWFSGLRHIFLIFLTLLLNALVLFLFKIPEDKRAGGPNDIIDETLTVLIPQTPYWFHGIALWVIGSVHLILSLWMVLEYFVKEKPNIIWTIPSIQKALSDLKQSIYRNKSFRELCQKMNQVFCNNKISINPPEGAKCFEIYFLSFSPVYRIIFLLCSIAALPTRGYFYCGCVLYILVKSDVLLTVLTAVRRSAYQLFSVLLLGLAVLLIYAVITFLLLSDYFNPDDDGSYTYCSSLIECYVSVIREGLLDTLGSGISLEYVGQLNRDFTKYWLRTIFDLSFFIIVTTLGLNIVVAILVDRFSELRSERDEVKKDKLNFCFICGIDNDTFERNAKGFRDHVVNDHSKWNYIYFVLHLHSMFTNDHNALEKYVYDNIKKRQIGFFPLREAKVLKNQEKT